jgi:hypothetical protein
MFSPFRKVLIALTIMSCAVLFQATASAANSEGNQAQPVGSGPAAQEEALIKQIQGLDRHGVGTKPLMVELARVDYLFRHNDVDAAQVRLKKLAETVKIHENRIAEKNAPRAVAPLAQTVLVPDYSANAPLVPPPPPMLLPGQALPRLFPGQTVLGGVPINQPAFNFKRTPSGERVFAISKMAMHMHMDGLTPEQVKATLSGLEKPDANGEKFLSSVLQKEVGALAPVPGPLRMERFLLARKISHLSQRPRLADPLTMQRLIAYYRQTEQLASQSGRGAEAKQQLVDGVRSIEKMLKMPDVVLGPETKSVSPTTQEPDTQ